MCSSPPFDTGLRSAAILISVVAQSLLRYARGMSSPSELHEIDPVVVPISEEFEMSMDEWLAGLRGIKPSVLPISTVQLLADARAEPE